MKKVLLISLTTFVFATVLTSCFSGRRSVSAYGGEVTGVSGSVFVEPTPYGMVLVDCGSMKEGAIGGRLALGHRLHGARCVG